MYLKQLIPTHHPDYVLIHYAPDSFEGPETVIVWNTSNGKTLYDGQIEERSFSSGDEEQRMIKYLAGKGSTIGYLLYNQFLLNLDTGLLNPFFQSGFMFSSEICYNGYQINKDETLVLNDGYVMGQNCYHDIYSHEQETSNDQGYNNVGEHWSQMQYFIERESFASKFEQEFADYKKKLEAFSEKPIFYFALLLKNNKQQSPFELAIEKNSPKLIELMINCLN